MVRRSLAPQLRSRGVTAVLGPTNTGKTHLAIERMIGHQSGIIGLPLRLLAREVYQRVVDRVGVQAVALITGEEKIKPERARYWICTVEAMPRDLDVAFVAIDEVQLAADLDRGHVFTDRLLNHRGSVETMLIGSSVARPLIESLVPGVHVTTRPRLSKLTFAGEKKLSRLPPRSAIVAFSAEEVYAVAELIRRQRGGAAVVLGALSPRTRNAQVALYQSGEVDYLVATDAVGMGLNLEVDHVAFAADRKFDGIRFRHLHPAEMGQIAGRAGRYLSDGTFGTTGRCPPLDPEIVEALENHHFEPQRVFQWRNSDLEFGTLAALQESLGRHPKEPGLTRAPFAEDVTALEIVAKDADIRSLARGRPAVQRLWDVCQVPDYRKTAPATHAELVATIFRFLMTEGNVPADWFARHVAMTDRTEGDIDTLSTRIAHVRTWTFVANRPDWLPDPEHWQAVTRQVEDKLSDALHERLASRFVDRRTSVLMRRLRENAMLEAEINAGGDVTVEGQHVGQLHGFHFVPDPQADGTEAKALRNAAAKALAGEIEARADRLSAAADSSLVLSNDGVIRWTGNPVARLEPADKLFDPSFRIVADEQLTGPAHDKVEVRLKAWLKAYVMRLLGPVTALEDSADLTGLSRGIGFQVAEALGVLERSKVAQEMRSLDQDGRAALRAKGLRFGAYHLYLPALLKPAPRILATQLWALKNGGLDQKGIDDIAHLAGSGRTSIPVDPEIGKGLYRAAGFRVCGGRAVRVDILERLADLIRPATAYRPGISQGEPPPGTADRDGFVATVGMTSLVGCAGEDFASILKSLGYVSDKRAGPAITVPLAAPPPPKAAPAAEAQPEAEAQPQNEEAVAVIGDDAPLAGKIVEDGAVAETDEPDPGVQDESMASQLSLRSASAATATEAAVTAASADAPEAEPVAAEIETGVVAATDEPDPDVQAEAPAPTADAPEPTLLAESGPESSVEALPDTSSLAAGEDDGTTQAAADLFPEIAVEPGDPDMPVEDEAPNPTLYAELASADDGAVESSPEAVETGSPDPGADSAAPPAEPDLIEVWRLNRQHREQHHARGRDQRRDRAGAERKPFHRPRPDRPDVAAPGQRPSGTQAQGEQQTRPFGDQQRPGRRPERDERGPRRDHKGPRSDHPRPDPGRRPPEPRRPPERREKAPDPNSPFAKLLALKAQLEAQDSDKR